MPMRMSDNGMLRKLYKASEDMGCYTESCEDPHLEENDIWFHDLDSKEMTEFQGKSNRRTRCVTAGSH